MCVRLPGWLCLFQPPGASESAKHRESERMSGSGVGVSLKVSGLSRTQCSVLNLRGCRDMGAEPVWVSSKGRRGRTSAQQTETEARKSLETQTRNDTGSVVN